MPDGFPGVIARVDDTIPALPLNVEEERVLAAATDVVDHVSLVGLVVDLSLHLAAAVAAGLVLLQTFAGGEEIATEVALAVAAETASCCDPADVSLSDPDLLLLVHMRADRPWGLCTAFATGLGPGAISQLSRPSAPCPGACGKELSSCAGFASKHHRLLFFM